MIVAILVIKPSTKGRPPQPKKSRFVLKGISITIFTRMWKALAWPNHFTNGWEVWAHKTSLTSRLFIKKNLYLCTKPGKWAIMYLCEGYRICLVLRIFYWIMKMFRQLFFPFTTSNAKQYTHIKYIYHMYY